MIKTSELRNLTNQELEQKLDALKKSLFEIRTQGTTGRVDKPSKISQTRREIARVLTVMREKSNVDTSYGGQRPT